MFLAFFSFDLRIRGVVGIVTDLFFPDLLVKNDWSSSSNGVGLRQRCVVEVLRGLSAVLSLVDKGDVGSELLKRNSSVRYRSTPLLFVLLDHSSACAPYFSVDFSTSDGTFRSREQRYKTNLWSRFHKILLFAGKKIKKRILKYGFSWLFRANESKKCSLGKLCTNTEQVKKTVS
jgi:hypothetical protein